MLSSFVGWHSEVPLSVGGLLSVGRSVPGGRALERGSQPLRRRPLWCVDLARPGAWARRVRRGRLRDERPERDTDYDSGNGLHLDLAVSKFLNKKLSVGVLASHYQQVTGDSGPGRASRRIQGARDCSRGDGRDTLSRPDKLRSRHASRFCARLRRTTAFAAPSDCSRCLSRSAGRRKPRPRSRPRSRCVTDRSGSDQRSERGGTGRLDHANISDRGRRRRELVRRSGSSELQCRSGRHGHASDRAHRLRDRALAGSLDRLAQPQRLALSSDSDVHRRSEWIDVVEDCRLAQHHLPDHVTRLDTVGEDRRETGASSRRAIGHVLVVEFDADDKGCRLDVSRRDSEAARLRLLSRDGLQHRLDFFGEGLTGQRLERFDRCPPQSRFHLWKRLSSFSLTHFQR